MAKKSTKKLTGGLLEFESSLCDLEYAPELLKRLLDLPEHNFHRDVESFKDAMKAAESAEIAAANAREVARRIALRVWKNAKENWTVKELQEATGYDDD